MVQRLDHAQLAPHAAERFLAFSMSLDGNLVDAKLRELVQLRASQLNGCAFCTDMHVKAARIAGERELRLHHVAVWRESPLFDERERAALEWTEALTEIGTHGVPKETYDEVRFVLGEALLAELSYVIVAINGWNRLSVAFTPVPGSADAYLGLDKAEMA